MRVFGSRMRRAGPLAAGLFAAVLVLGLVPTVDAQTYGVGAPIELRGIANGTIAHVGAVQAGETEVANIDVAQSSAIADADADGVGAQKVNEMNRLMQPAQDNKFSYGRGVGLEVGLGQTAGSEGQIQLFGRAEQAAPPDNDKPATEELAVEGLDPVAYASAARGQALANAQDSGLIPEVCVLGDDISRGLGYAADVELVDAGGDENSPQFDAALVALDDVNARRSVSQSASRTRLVPTGTPNNFGLQSETRQTFAPITLFQADPLAGGDPVRLLTIELLGEWVLRSTALGKTGGAKVEYGTGDANTGGLVGDVTSIVRIIDGEGTPFQLNFEDLLGPDGLEIPIDPVVNISIAEQPRKLAAPGAFPDPASTPDVAANGTSAVAAVDILRVRVLGAAEDSVLAEFRAGHMETSAQVPAGGVNCPIPVTKTADPKSINIGTSGNTSKISITVHNVFDCDLEGVVLTDRIRQRTADPDFKLIAGDPTPKSPDLPTGNLTTADVVWELGDIPRGEKRTVTLDLQSATRGGIIRDIAEAVGKLANCLGEDAAGIGIAGLNLSGLSNPVDIAIPLAVTGVGGMATPAAGAALSVAALGVAAFLRRRRR